MGAPLDRAFGEILGKARRAVRRQGRLDAPHRHRASARSARSRSSAPTCRSPSARRSPPATAAPTRSRSASSATARRTSARFHEAMNLASIWRLPVDLRVREQPLRRVLAARARPRRSSGSPTAPTPTRWPRRAIDGNDVLAVHAATATAAARARAGEGPDADRGADLPPQGPLALRPGELPARGRAGALARARPDPAVTSGRWPPRACEQARARRGARRGASATVAAALERAQSWADPGPARASRTSTREPDQSTYTTYSAITRGAWPTRSRPTRTSSCSARTSARPAARSRRQRGAARALRARARAATRRSPSRRSSAPRSAPRCRACGRSPRSCSPTSRASASTRSPNQLAKYRYMTGGQVAVPVTIRMANGAGAGFARPALAVRRELVPQRARAEDRGAGDAGRRVRAAARGDRGPRPGARLRAQGACSTPRASSATRPATLPLGRADVVRAGERRDGRRDAADAPPRARGGRGAGGGGRRGRGDRPADARAARPRDDRRAASTGRTGSWSCRRRPPAAAGAPSLVAALLQDRFELLDAPPLLVAADETPVPYAAPLEAAWMPSAERIADGIRRTLAY